MGFVTKNKSTLLLSGLLYLCALTYVLRSRPHYVSVILPESDDKSNFNDKDGLHKNFEFLNTETSHAFRGNSDQSLPNSDYFETETLVDDTVYDSSEESEVTSSEYSKIDSDTNKEVSDRQDSSAKRRKRALDFEPRRKNLLFANIGERSEKAVASWFEGYGERNFDVVLYFFEPEKFPAPSLCRIGNSKYQDFADVCYNHTGFKWPSLYHFLTENKIDRDDYQSVFAIDDDILLQKSDINELFNTFEDFKLLFAQPSYQGDVSDLHFPRIQRWRGNTVVRYSNFVENAAMLVHFGTLMDKLLPVLRDSISGWGVDYCFFHVANADIHEIGTIHTVKAIHPPATKVTKASQAFVSNDMTDSDIKINKYGGVVPVSRDTVNRREGEALMRKYGAFMYIPKVFFRVRPGEDREEVIRKEKPNYSQYYAFRHVKSRW